MVRLGGGGLKDLSEAIDDDPRMIWRAGVKGL